MRRTHPGRVIILVMLAGLVLYLLIAKPVIVLPPVTVSLPADHPLQNYLTLLKIRQLDVTLRTNGRLSLAADGQRLGFLSYNLDSLRNAMELASRLLLPQSVGAAALGLTTPLLLLVCFPFLLPPFAWNLVMAGLWAYFIIPVEFTLRLTGG